MRFARLMLLVTVLPLIGCGSDEGPPKETVRGTVSLDGTPLANGTVVFDPADGKGPSASGPVVNGKFEFDSPAGPKNVLISAPPKPTGEKDEYGEDITENVIPTRYSSGEEFSAEVKADGENTFDFPMTTEPASN